MSMNLITVLYLVASICFIQALKGLVAPDDLASRATCSACSAWVLAVLTTVALIYKLGAEIATAGIGYVIVGLLVGRYCRYRDGQACGNDQDARAGRLHAQHDRPGCGVFIAIAAVGRAAVLGYRCRTGPMRFRPVTVWNCSSVLAIGAITFSGSVIAFGKLSGKYKFRLFQGAPVQFKGQHWVNLAIGLAILGFWVCVVHLHRLILTAFAILLALAFVIGRADHHPDWRLQTLPVVVSMLNSYSGWAAAGIGLLAEQLDADHRRLPGGLLRRYPLVHHVQGDEPLVLQRDPRWFSAALQQKLAQPEPKKHVRLNPVRATMRPSC